MPPCRARHSSSAFVLLRSSSLATSARAHHASREAVTRAFAFARAVMRALSKEVFVACGAQCKRLEDVACASVALEHRAVDHVAQI